MNLFVKTKRLIQLINMSNLYRCRPSELLHIEEEYAAWCLDEACMFVKLKIDDGEEPVFKKQYTSFSSIYGDLRKGGVICP